MEFPNIFLEKMGYTNFTVVQRNDCEITLTALKKKKSSVIIKVCLVEDEDDLKIYEKRFQIAEKLSKMEIGPKVIETLLFHENKVIKFMMLVLGHHSFANTFASLKEDVLSLPKDKSLADLFNKLKSNQICLCQPNPEKLIFHRDRWMLIDFYEWQQPMNTLDSMVFLLSVGPFVKKDGPSFQVMKESSATKDPFFWDYFVDTRTK